MAGALPLERMSTGEKLRAMEELWADLSRAPENIPVPDWHVRELQARSGEHQAGTTVAHEWSEVKRRLRDLTQ